MPLGRRNSWSRQSSHTRFIGSFHSSTRNASGERRLVHRFSGPCQPGHTAKENLSVGNRAASDPQEQSVRLIHAHMSSPELHSALGASLCLALREPQARIYTEVTAGTTEPTDVQGRSLEKEYWAPPADKQLPRVVFCTHIGITWESECPHATPLVGTTAARAPGDSAVSRHQGTFTGVPKRRELLSSNTSAKLGLNHHILA